MTDLQIDEDEGSTPITEEEREDLIPSYITLRSELNEAEHEAEEWEFKSKRDVLSETFLKNLHKKMLGKIWRWAGVIRTSERNIGVDAYRITTELRVLIEDCKCWIEFESYEPDEIAARFSHRLVKIHPFPNGNGRHSRTAADLLLLSLEQERFTWGRSSLVDVGETRKKYIEALHATDSHDYAPFFEFVRS